MSTCEKIKKIEAYFQNKYNKCYNYLYYRMKINFKYLFLFLIFVFPNFTNAAYLASDLLGQLDGSDNPVFTTNTINNGAGLVNSKGFGTTLTSKLLDSINHRLYVTDSSNNRVLVFNLDENNNLIDRVADYVLGQADFTTNAVGTTQNTMRVPQCLAHDSVRNLLFVCDINNRRVLVFDVSTISNGMNASYVLGQATFDTSTTALTQNGMSRPFGSIYDQNNNRLFVSERDVNRILVYDLNIISNGENASYVLGQPNFTTSTGTTTQNGLIGPQYGLAYDHVNNRLFASDPGNSRVLVFDVTPSHMSDGMNASYVLGRPDFTTSTATTTQSGMSFPVGLAYDPVNNQLFSSELFNNRVSIYDVAVANISNGQNARAVIGQNDFTSAVVATTQANFNGAISTIYDSGNNRIYVSDINNSRIMIFNFVKLSTTNPSDGITGTIYSHTLTSTQSQGTVSYAVTSGALPDGLTLNTTTGEISGTPTLAGSYNFTVQATDDNGAIGSFVSQPQEYTLVVAEPHKTTSGSVAMFRYTYTPTVPEPIITPTVQEPTTPNTTHYTFTRNLKLKDTGEDVKKLQKYLNTYGYPVASTGPGLPAQAGSLGNESTYFGVKTKTALIKFQIANNIKPALGYFGPITRAILLKAQ